MHFHVIYDRSALIQNPLRELSLFDAITHLLPNIINYRYICYLRFTKVEGKQKQTKNLHYKIVHRAHLFENRDR